MMYYLCIDSNSTIFLSLAGEIKTPPNVVALATHDRSVTDTN